MEMGDADSSVDDGIGLDPSEHDEQGLMMNLRRLDVMLDSMLAMSARLRRTERRITEVEQVVRHQVELSHQERLKCNICIMGVPLVPDENLESIVRTICQLINVKLDEHAILSTKRSSGGHTNAIFVKFASESTKYEILQARRGKTICVSDVIRGAGQTDARVYINPHVTPFFSYILSHGRELIKVGALHACWMTSRGVAVKRKKNDERIIVNCCERIHSLLIDHFDN